MSTVFFVTGCEGNGDNSNTPPSLDTPTTQADSKTQSDPTTLPNQDSPSTQAPESKFQKGTWQYEFEKHQLEAAKLPPKGNGYVVTQDNEMLIYRFGGVQSAIGSIRINNLQIIGGKVFIDEKRIYDIGFLEKIVRGEIGFSGFSAAAEPFKVDPSPEDQKLLEDGKAGKSPEVKIESLAKASLALGLDSVTDHTQRHFFKSVPNASASQGQLNLNGQSYALPTPMVINLNDLHVNAIGKIGSVAIKSGHHYMGAVFGASLSVNTTHITHVETSAAYGIQFERMFIEAQAGSFSHTSGHLYAPQSGGRYQVTLGVDTSLNTTPFVRLLSRSLGQTQKTLGGFGIESSLSKAVIGSTTLQSNLSAAYLTDAKSHMWHMAYTAQAKFSDATCLNLSLDLDHIYDFAFSLQWSAER